MPEESTPDSCITKKPFMELGTENAPKLSYKLPQTSSFEANIPIKLAIDSGDFIQEHGIAIIDGGEATYYTRIGGDENVIAANIGNAFVARYSKGPILTTESEIIYTEGIIPIAEAAVTSMGTAGINSDVQISNYPVLELAKLAKEGYPVENIDFAGNKTNLEKIGMLTSNETCNITLSTINTSNQVQRRILNIKSDPRWNAQNE
jgi:hypothetical protein